MNQLTTIAKLPGSGAGSMSAMRGEEGKARAKVVIGLDFASGPDKTILQIVAADAAKAIVAQVVEAYFAAAKHRRAQ